MASKNELAAIIAVFPLKNRACRYFEGPGPGLRRPARASRRAAQLPRRAAQTSRSVARSPRSSAQLLRRPARLSSQPEQFSSQPAQTPRSMAQTPGSTSHRLEDLAQGSGEISRTSRRAARASRRVSRNLRQMDEGLRGLAGKSRGCTESSGKSARKNKALQNNYLREQATQPHPGWSVFQVDRPPRGPKPSTTAGVGSSVPPSRRRPTAGRTRPGGFDARGQQRGPPIREGVCQRSMWRVVGQNGRWPDRTLTSARRSLSCRSAYGPSEAPSFQLTSKVRSINRSDQGHA